MAEKTKKRLRTPAEISEANEDLYNDVRNGQIDNKTADACNTVIKSQIYLNVKLRMDYLKIYTQAAMKKITLPPGIMPPMGE
jgi:hypothetical protein